MGSFIVAILIIIIEPSLRPLSILLVTTKSTLLVTWDVMISRCLSVCLIASAGVRSWDIHLTRAHDRSTGYFMKWKDIRVEMVDSASLISRLRFTITFEYEKGYKDSKNTWQRMCGKDRFKLPSFRHSGPHAGNRYWSRSRRCQ